MAAARGGWRPGVECATMAKMPDRNTQWLIGALIAFAALLWTQHGATSARLDELGARIDDLRSEMSDFRTEIRSEMSDLRTQMNDLRTEIRAEIRELDARVRAVEIELGKVNQRLTALERAILPATPPAD